VNKVARHVRIAIAGAGFAGIGAAIRLKQEGFDDFLILERAAAVGGVWRDNAYPGCACDVQSHLYCFSFAPNPEWSRVYSPQAEIWAYLRGCIERFGLTAHLRCNCTLREAAWDAHAQRWRLDTSIGEFTSDVLVSAVGALSEPSLPALSGLERFTGRAFHSAQWDHAYDLRDKQVAVVGTGASAVQFVPQIQPQVAKLTLLQRTPVWVVPRRDSAYTPAEQKRLRVSTVARACKRGALYLERELMAPFFLHPRVAWIAEWSARRHLARSVRNPELRAKLTPSYRIGCKRILVSDDYLPALTQPNVEVVTVPIREVHERSLFTADGLERPIDALIFGTGFQVTEMPFARHVRGRDGRTLAEAWNGSMRAHMGVMVAGFPNLFMIPGPNTGLGHSSMILMIEAQIEHLIGALSFLKRGALAAVEPLPAAQGQFVAEIDRKMSTTVWSTGGCKSWYLDRTGRNSTLWPGYTFSYMRRVRRFRPREYVVESRRNAENGRARIEEAVQSHATATTLRESVDRGL
jgi:cation diffusion facilitator CzcD-associated flavoprotein CzcO